MSGCVHVHQQLAAYRRDDWAPSDLDTLTQHLTTCVECRQLEAAYRQVGEGIRQLPSITPPPEFRERVFAAIRADQRRLPASIARAAGATTNPAIPVVRPSARIIRPVKTYFRPRAALAMAAVIVLTLLTARIFAQGGPGVLGGNAASLPSVSPFAFGVSGGHNITRYPLGAHYTLVTGALATGAWLAYSATDASQRVMLFAENRKTGQRTPLLSAPRQGAVTLRSLTDRWLIWSTGAGTTGAPWALYASQLPSTAGQASMTLTLADSSISTSDTPATLGGIWADGDTVLVAAATASGNGILLNYDLSNNTPISTVITRSSTAGHLLTDPSLSNDSYYWADVWFDHTTGLHSAIWREDADGHTQALSSDTEAFHPQAVQNTLVWVEVAAHALIPTNEAQSQQPDADSDEQMLSQLAGTLQAQSLTSGQQWQISAQANVASVQAVGPVILWRSGSQTHTYDLRANAPSGVDTQVRQANFASATASSIVWDSGASSPLYVYDAR